MAEYQITIDGLRGSSLVPYAEELGEIAADNSRRSDESLVRTLMQMPEEAREKVKEMLKADQEKAPFYVSGARILLRDTNWGVVRTELEDVRTLSRKHPEQIFFFLLISDADGRLVEYEDLENFWRGRIQDGEITAQYEANPITWSEKAHF